jgi:hypothetical protein
MRVSESQIDELAPNATRDRNVITRRSALNLRQWDASRNYEARPTTINWNVLRTFGH